MEVFWNGKWYRVVDASGNMVCIFVNGRDMWTYYAGMRVRQVQA